MAKQSRWHMVNTQVSSAGRRTGWWSSEEGMAIILTLMVTAAISVIALSLVLITEIDTKIALATQINKENLNVGDGALNYALNIIREKPTAGYLNYPWERVLPPVAEVRRNTDGSAFLDNGKLSGGTPNNPSFTSASGASDFDGYSSTPTTVTYPASSANIVKRYGQMYVLADMAGSNIENVPMYGLAVEELTTYAYYSVFVEATQGDSDWNNNSTSLSWGDHTPDGALDQHDFDKYGLLVRARVVGLYGSVKDVVMLVKLVKPDGTPYSDVPGSTQGGSTGPSGTTPVGFTQT